MQLSRQFDLRVCGAAAESSALSASANAVFAVLLGYRLLLTVDDISKVSIVDLIGNRAAKTWRNPSIQSIKQIVELLRTMIGFLEYSLGVFIAEVILESNVNHTSWGKVIAPEFESV